jgi:hypothetical protein
MVNRYALAEAKYEANKANEQALVILNQNYIRANSEINNLQAEIQELKKQKPIETTIVKGKDDFKVLNELTQRLEGKDL